MKLLMQHEREHYDHLHQQMYADKLKNKREEKQMGTIGEEAMDYEPPQTKNIADLPEVSVDVELVDREGTDKDGKTFKYKAVLVNDEEYRVPGVVLGDLKAIKEKKPDLKTFSVTKKGVGLQTKYTVIPL